MADVDRVITLKLDADFAKLYEAIRKQYPQYDKFDTINEPALALDPGETTGVAAFDGDQTIVVTQHLTQNIGQSYNWLLDTIEAGVLIEGNHFPYDAKFSHLRVENYRVYEWKAKDHAWSPVHTIQWIGAIRVAADQTNTPISFCMAQHAKTWWTDQKLDVFGLNPKGLRHGRDALRHLLYYLLFPTKDADAQ